MMMNGWQRFISSIGEARILAFLGGLEVAMAAVRIIFQQQGGPLSAVVATDLLIVLPGVALIYGGYRLPDTDLHPDVYPRIVSRCFAGIGVMLGFMGVLALSTGLNRPVFTPLAGTALGSAAGFAIGLNEARALSKAHEAKEAQREAEQRTEELRQERNLRERIVDTSPVGICVVQPDGAISFANEFAADIVGLPEDEFTELRYDEPMFVDTDAEENPANDSLFERILATGEAVTNEEGQITRPDGQQIWLSVNGAPLHDSSGELTSVIFAFEDITERKERERELEESNERLEQFAYAASHDLQEPLRMVSSYLRLLENRYGDDLDEDAQEFIDFATDGADRMRTMIENLLQYSRVTTRGEPLEPTDAEAVLDDVLDDLQLRIEETDATITTDELPTVTADPDQLAQVFQNLLSNALVYSGDDPPRVHVSAERDGDEWVVSVRDEGIGIEPDDQDRIFDVFQRLHAADEYEGSGVGLALCDRIVERHGGTIWVESTPGEGTTFSFTIPVTRDQRPESPAPSSSSGEERQ